MAGTVIPDLVAGVTAVEAEQVGLGLGEQGPDYSLTEGGRHLQRAPEGGEGVAEVGDGS